MVSGVSEQYAIKDSVLVDALESMRNYGKMDALVCPWGPSNETMKDELYKVVSSGIPVILPAGNEPSQNRLLMEKNGRLILRSLELQLLNV